MPIEYDSIGYSYHRRQQRQRQLTLSSYFSFTWTILTNKFILIKMVQRDLGGWLGGKCSGLVKSSGEISYEMGTNGSWIIALMIDVSGIAFDKAKQNWLLKARYCCSFGNLPILSMLSTRILPVSTCVYRTQLLPDFFNNTRITNSIPWINDCITLSKNDNILNKDDISQLTR